MVKHMKSVWFLLAPLMWVLLSCQQTTEPSDNHAPVIGNIVFSADTIAPGGTSRVSASVVDVDGDSLTSYWQSDAGTVTSNGAKAQWTLPADTSGFYWIYYRVSDAAGAYDEDSATVWVHPDGFYNQPPVIERISFSADTAIAGNAVRVYISACDPDGDDFTQYWDSDIA